MKFKVVKRQIKHVKELLIGDNSDYIAQFEFDEEWNKVTKTARFINCGKFVDVILENDQCIIPCEVLKCGHMKVGVYSATMATTDCQVYITDSIKEEDGNVCEPTLDVYEQLLERLDNIDPGEKGISEDDMKAYVEEQLNRLDIPEDKTAEIEGLDKRVTDLENAGGGSSGGSVKLYNHHIYLSSWNYSGSDRFEIDLDVISTNPTFDVSMINNKRFACGGYIETYPNDATSPESLVRPYSIEFINATSYIDGALTVETVGGNSYFKNVSTGEGFVCGYSLANSPITMDCYTYEIV